MFSGPALRSKCKSDFASGYIGLRHLGICAINTSLALRRWVFWLRFGQERSALDVLRELAGMLDVDISALREQQAAIVDAIARWLDTRRCLLILDDVWCGLWSRRSRPRGCMPSGC